VNNRVRRVAPAALALLLTACGEDRPTLAIAQEYPQPNEGEVARELIALTKEASEEARKDAGSDGPSAGRMLRFNQPRHAGCLKADFTVPPGLPDELRVGVFAAPRSFPAWIRFASATAEPDTEKDFRGMSIKLIGVPGGKLHGPTDDPGDTHDFVLNSHPVLFVGTPEDFRDFVDYNLNLTPLLFFLNPFNPHFKELGIVRDGRQHHASHLAIPYWSTTPYLYGEGRAVKYSARPCGGSRAAQLPDELTDGYLRAAMRAQMNGAGACFDFMVQFQADAERMPIEDATVEWDESLSPFRTVARIDIPPQTFESPRQMAFCENLAFNPWRSLPEHRPLGGINRARRDLYQELAEFRHQRNGVAYAEPNGDEKF
jgi:hypothetical protein